GRGPLRPAGQSRRASGRAAARQRNSRPVLQRTVRRSRMEGMPLSGEAVIRKQGAIPVVREARRTLPIRVWAGIGALILAFEGFVIIKWVSGAYFTSVHTGPTPIPDWMLISLRTMEVAFFALWMWCIWHFVVQPYRRDGRFSTDGLLCLAFFFFAWFQDPLANYG